MDVRLIFEYTMAQFFVEDVSYVTTPQSDNRWSKILKNNMCAVKDICAENAQRIPPRHGLESVPKRVCTMSAARNILGE